jgi:hypothetical protein
MKFAVVALSGRRAMPTYEDLSKIALRVLAQLNNHLLQQPFTIAPLGLLIIGLRR